MYRSGLVDTLVTHANMKVFGLTPLFGDRRGYMPPQLKTKTGLMQDWVFGLGYRLRISILKWWESSGFFSNQSRHRLTAVLKIIRFREEQGTKR